MSGPALEINVNNRDLSLGVSQLSNIEKLLERLVKLNEKNGKSLAVRQKTLNQQNNTLNQTVRITNKYTQNVKIINNQLDETNRKTKQWENRLTRIGRMFGRIGRGASRIGVGAAGLGGGIGNSLQARGGQAFGGLFGGGGIAGLAGGAVRAPFAVAEFGLRIGGDLGQSIITGVGKTLAGAGGAVSNIAGGFGGLIGAPLAIAGGAIGLAGPIVGALGQAGGAVLGAAGELGGQIAEKLVGALSVGLGAATIATGFSLKSAAKYERLSPSFQSLTGGADQEQTLQRLSDAVDGTVSKVDLLSIANRALSLGAVKSVDELIELAKAAQQLGNTMDRSTKDAIEDLSLGLARGSKLILDNVGLIINAKEAHEAYAEAIGTTASQLDEAEKREAVRIFGLDQANKKVAAATKNTNEQTRASEKLFKVYEQVKASVQDLSNEWGLSLLPVAKKIASEFKELTTGATEWVKLHREEITTKVMGFWESLPGWIASAQKAVSSFGLAIKSAFGFADDSRASELIDLVTNGGPRAGAPGGPAGPRLAGGHSNSIQNPFSSTLSRIGSKVGPLFERVKDGFVSAITSEQVKGAAVQVGAWMGEGLWSFAKSGFSNADDALDSGLMGKVIGAGQKVGGFVGNVQGTLGRFSTNAAKSIFSPSSAIQGAQNIGGLFKAPGFLGPINQVLIQQAQEQQAAQSLALERLGGSASIPGVKEGVFSRIAAGGGGVSISGQVNRAIIATFKAIRVPMEESARAITEETRQREKSLSAFVRAKNAEIRTVERFAEAKQRELAGLEDDRYDDTANRIADLRDIEADRRGQVSALPGQTLRGFEGDINTPGLSLRARNQLLFRQRKQEAERVARINKTFGSRGPSDAFGSTPGLAGFGAGLGGGGGALPGISGSVSASQAQAELFEQIKASAAFREEVAAINAAAAKETAVVEAESLALQKQLNEAIVAARTAAEAARIEQNKLNAELAKRVNEDKAAIDKNKAEIVKVKATIGKLR